MGRRWRKRQGDGLSGSELIGGVDRSPILFVLLYSPRTDSLAAVETSPLLTLVYKTSTVLNLDGEPSTDTSRVTATVFRT